MSASQPAAWRHRMAGGDRSPADNLGGVMVSNLLSRSPVGFTPGLPNAPATDEQFAIDVPDIGPMGCGSDFYQIFLIVSRNLPREAEQDHVYYITQRTRSYCVTGMNSHGAGWRSNVPWRRSGRISENSVI